jgi:hypothetical protein
MRFIGVLLFVITTILSNVIFLSSAAQAQAADNALTLSPLRREITMNPGTVYDGSLTLKNSGITPQQIRLSVESFNITNQTYDYLFTAGTKETDWIKFETNDLRLTNDETVIVPFRISVPISTEPGGYYLALFAQREPLPDTVGGIVPAERLASLVYLNINGDTSRLGRLVRLNAPSVTFRQASWTAAIQNTGTTHFRSTYSLQLKNLGGRSFYEKQDSRLILPQTIRLVEQELPAPAIAGIYQASYSISLGDAPPHEETRWFVYVPPLQLILFVLIVASSVWLVRLRRSTN